LKAKNGNNKIVSFNVCIRTADFKYFKCFPSRVQAKADLIRQNIKNKLEIKNTMLDPGNHYLVRLHGGKNFLADKVDLHFIEANIWCSRYDYICCKQNGKQIQFHNLILGHTPASNATVDHVNRNPLDNRRLNLRIATWQTQMINRNPQNMANQSGVNLNKNYWIKTWRDSFKIQKAAAFNTNKYGYEIAKQKAIDKRNEMELNLNHYRIALHGLPPIELQELNPNYDFEEPEEPDEI